jgi:hypothetical protein
MRFRAAEVGHGQERRSSYDSATPVSTDLTRTSPAASASPAPSPSRIFAIVYRRLVPRLGHAQAIGAITHRLCRLIWKILHQRVRYEERGPAVSEEAKKVRARKMIRELRSLGYQVTRVSPAPTA